MPRIVLCHEIHARPSSGDSHDPHSRTSSSGTGSKARRPATKPTARAGASPIPDHEMRHPASGSPPYTGEGYARPREDGNPLQYTRQRVNFVDICSTHQRAFTATGRDYPSTPTDGPSVTAARWRRRGENDTPPSTPATEDARGPSSTVVSDLRNSIYGRYCYFLTQQRVRCQRRSPSGVRSEPGGAPRRTHSPGRRSPDPGRRCPPGGCGHRRRHCDSRQVPGPAPSPSIFPTRPVGKSAVLAGDAAAPTDPAERQPIPAVDPGSRPGRSAAPTGMPTAKPVTKRVSRVSEGLLANRFRLP